MDTRCPLCQSPIALGDAPTDVLNTISSVDCPNCGLVPLYANRPTITLEQPKGRETIAHFQLERVLGRGSFGTVWLARDTHLGRKVALKVSVQADRDTGALVHEAQAAAELKHPNIVSIFEVGSEEGQVYIASEYIDGVNLRDLLGAGRPNTDKAVDLAMTIAVALQHAHDQGIVHRDIKPSNIMLSAQGQPFVTDFGLAKRMLGDASISAEGQVLGTALYMSPEQASGQTARIDGRSDIYALGVTLFEMLTGYVPFRGNVHAVLNQKTQIEAPSPRTLNPKVPRDLETICLKCLERDPDKRYQSAQEVADELRRFQTGVPIKARPVSAIEKAGRWCLRNKAVTTLVAGLFATLTLGLVSVSFFWRESAAHAGLANRRLYRSEMNLAAQYLAKADVGGVRRTLERFESGSRLSRLRDFAWYYHKAAVSPFLQVTNEGDPVVDVAVSADARFYAACGRGREIRVWDARTGELVRTLSIEDGRFNSIAFSAVSGQLASGSTDGFVRIWSPLKHERPIQQIKHGRQVKLVRFSPDGKRLLSMGRLGAARIWDVGTESLTRAIPTGMSESKDARFSPDGSSIAVATQDGRIRVWRNGSEIPQILEPNPLIESLVFSDDGKRIVTGSYSGVIRSWSVADGNLIDVHETGLGIIGDLEFLKGTSLLATPTIAGQLLVFDTEARREIRSLRTHSLTGGILDRSANGRVLAVGSGGGSVKLLKVAELTRPDTFWHTASAQDDEQGVRADTTPGRAVGNPIRGLAIPAGGRYVVAASADGAVSKWNIDNGIPQPLFLAKDDRDPLLCASSDPAGRYVACGYQKSGLALWNLKTGKPGRNIDVGEAAVVAVAFSTKGDVLAVATGEGRLRAFAGADLARLRFEESPPEGEVNAVVFSPDGQELVVAYNDGVVLFLDASTGRPRRKRLRLPSIPLTAVYCEAGALLAVGTQTGAIEFIEVGDGSVRRTIHAHSSRVNVVAAFPDGRTIVSGGRDKELKLWDTGSGDLITTLYGHGRQILSIAVSPDGRTVASGGLLGDVRVWRSGTR